MRSIQIIVAAAFMLSATQVFAHHDDKNGPCASYMDACKSDSTVTGATGKAKWKAMHECVKNAAAADTTSGNGPKCTAAQAKHHEHMDHMKGNEGAAPAAPASGT